MGDTSNPTTPPLVSIALPVLDGGGLLSRALDALRAQTWERLEIVVSDNASEDETPDILVDAARDPRVRVVRQSHRLSPFDSFAAALDLTEGPYVMWAAHDDVWDPDHVERLVSHHVADPSIALAAGIPHVIDERGSVLRSYPEALELDVADVAERLARFIEQPEPLGKANLIYGVFRRDVLSAVDPRSFWAADARRADTHLVFAALALGRGVVDPDVRFFKGRSAVVAAGGLPNPVRLARSARTVRRWLAAYGPVIDGLGLDASTAARLHEVVRGRQRRLLAESARRLVGRRAD